MARAVHARPGAGPPRATPAPGRTEPTTVHLRHVIAEYVKHYNEERPRQARGNVPPPVAQAEDAGPPSILPFPSGNVRRRERFSGGSGTTTAPRPDFLDHQ